MFPHDLLAIVLIVNVKTISLARFLLVVRMLIFIDISAMLRVEKRTQLSMQGLKPVICG
jgi:hypothetical protein